MKLRGRISSLKKRGTAEVPPPKAAQGSGDDEDPSWSPDGHHILFASSRDGGGKQLYVMTADGNAQTRITNGTGSFSNPQWGPRAR